jgi:hypothetical protein
MTHSPAPEPTVLLRTLLVRALRDHRFGAVCKGETHDFKASAERLSRAMMSFVFISLALYASIELGWGLYTALSAIFGALFFGVVFIAMHSMSAQRFGKLTLLLWVISVIVLIVQGDGAAILAIYGSALAIVFGAILSYRALQAAARIQLFIPVAFIVVLAPLLTQDPWKLVPGSRRCVLRRAGSALPADHRGVAARTRPPPRRRAPSAPPQRCSSSTTVAAWADRAGCCVRSHPDPRLGPEIITAAPGVGYHAVQGTGRRTGSSPMSNASPSLYTRAYTA